MIVNRRRFLSQSAAVIAATQMVRPVFAKEAKIQAVAFDAFTIFDGRPVVAKAEALFPTHGAEIANLWRTRIFEYCWLRTLNGGYVDFWQILSESLIFTLKTLKIEASEAQRNQLRDVFIELQPWPDSVTALTTMRENGLRLAYLSNFTDAMLNTLGGNARINSLFEHRLSTDRVGFYKPDPRAYAMAAAAFKLPKSAIAFAAFGGWDAAGAKSYGFNTFWVNRAKAEIEELGVRPDGIGTTLTELSSYLLG